MDQLHLQYHIDENTLRSHLEQRSGKKIVLIITDNATSMLSFRRQKNSISLRLNRIFLSAGEDVLDEIAAFLRNKIKKTPLINGFIKQNTCLLRKKPARKVSIKTKGRYNDLRHVYDSINKKYFGNRVSAKITWGVRSPRRVAAKETLGSYCSDNNLIRISPVLDSRRVPRYFLEYVVYHEMLHADTGIDRRRGKRRMVHDREFRRRERLFKDYEKAVAWERNYL